jgi:hypothetical protein
LQLADDAQALEMLASVITDASADHGRRKESARLMGADVSHRKTALERKLLDGQWVRLV